MGPSCSIKLFGSIAFLLVTVEFGKSNPLTNPQNEEIGPGEEIKMPAKVQKAGGEGGILNQPHVNENKQFSKLKVDVDSADKINTNDDDVLSENRKRRCPRGPRRMYYHKRGKQCVPRHCKGGNRWRNQNTGECALEPSPTYSQRRRNYDENPQNYGRGRRIYEKKQQRKLMKG